jgi:DNA-binding NarL/FixJ family response regulator
MALPKAPAKPYRLYMLEPRGADSSMFDKAADDSARVVKHARDALSQGRIADALDSVDRARHDDGLDDLGRVALALTGLLAKLALGDLRGASTYSRDLTNLMRVRGVVGATASFGLGEFAAARGQEDQAVSYFERAGEELAASGEHVWLPWRSGLARVIAGRGEIATATALVEEELSDARTFDTSYAVAYALRTQAAIAPTGDRVGLLDEALELLHGIGAARLDAQIRTDLAAWILLLQPHDSARAVDLLRGAEKYARQEDLGPLLSRIRWLLERLGEAPDGELPGRMAELSAAERRVAQLIVVGKRNREIATELGVSVKSVEWHVSHILRKLSITSRTELAGALAQPRQAR